MGESDTHGYPRCLPQRKGENYGGSFLDRILTTYKVEPSGFSSTKLLAELIRDTEDLYTSHFGECRVSYPRTTTYVKMKNSSWRQEESTFPSSRWMEPRDSLFRYVPMWSVFRFGGTCSGGRVVQKYAFILRGWVLLVERLSRLSTIY